MLVRCSVTESASRNIRGAESEEGEVGGSGDGVITMLKRSAKNWSLTPKLACVAGGI